MSDELKQFKVDKDNVCKVYGEKVDELSSIKITTTNHGKHYLGSGMPWRNVYSIKCCQKCFDAVVKSLEVTLYDRAK